MRFHGGDSGEKLTKKETLVCALVAIGILGLLFVWIVFVVPWFDSVVIINSFWLDKAVDFVFWFIGLMPLLLWFLGQPIWLRVINRLRR